MSLIHYGIGHCSATIIIFSILCFCWILESKEVVFDRRLFDRRLIITMDDDDYPRVENILPGATQILVQTHAVDSTFSNVCWRCNKAGSESSPLERCALCKRAYYCNATCRDMHWHTHRLYCEPVSSQEALSKADGYTQFNGTYNRKQVYELQCEQCYGDMFCGRVVSGCPKAMAWQAIFTAINAPSLRGLIATIHQFHKNRAVGQEQQMSALFNAFRLYEENKATLSHEDSWLYKNFLAYCEIAARELTPLPYLQDSDHSDDHPPVALSAGVVRCFGRDDKDKDQLAVATVTAHFILHATSRQLAKNYQPNNNPEIIMKLARFLEKIFYNVDIKVRFRGSHLLIQPADLFLVYLAKKRARILLEGQETKEGTR